MGVYSTRTSYEQKTPVKQIWEARIERKKREDVGKPVIKQRLKYCKGTNGGVKRLWYKGLRKVCGKLNLVKILCTTVCKSCELYTLYYWTSGVSWPLVCLFGACLAILFERINQFLKNFTWGSPYFTLQSPFFQIDHTKNWRDGGNISKIHSIKVNYRVNV